MDVYACALDQTGLHEMRFLSNYTGSVRERERGGGKVRLREGGGEGETGRVRGGKGIRRVREMKENGAKGQQNSSNMCDP